MKRSQVDEDNCGHWEFEVQNPEGGTLVQSSMPRGFGTTATRRSRFLRALSRDFTAGMILVGMATGVDETFNTLQRARTDVPATTEQGSDRRTSLVVAGTNEKSSGSHINSETMMSDGDGVLDATEDPVFDVHEVQVPGSVLSELDELSRATTSNSLQELVSAADTDETHQDYGEDDREKENRDPLADRGVLPHRSPLPEWFPRIPLQDITNVLACGLDDEQPQPKKKRNKKMGTTLAPTLLALQDIPARNAPAITHPKPFSCATPKQAGNLRKNFR